MSMFLKSGFLAAIMFLNFLNAKVLLNENILNDLVENNISITSDMLYEKTGVRVALALSDRRDLNALYTYEQNLSSPYILLVLSKKEHKVDILASKDALLYFDKEKVLSPYPEEGTILPILSNPKQKDIYNAAIFNGYADIVDQVAKYFNIKAFYGNSNRDTLNIMRILIYGFLCVALLMLVQRRIKKKGL